MLAWEMRLEELKKSKPKEKRSRKRSPSKETPKIRERESLKKRSK